MTHTQRKKSETGFYHVITKGDGGQILFECDDNRLRYLAELESAVNETRVNVHAYCLMSNHVHLVVEDREGDLSTFMKRLNERYAMYYSKHSGRVGHVFQGRFWSEPIESDEYFLAAVRYVHANPEPAGISRACDYTWSSYNVYANAGKSTFVKTETVLGILGSRSAFERFQDHGGRYVKPFPKSTLTKHLSYDELLRVAVDVLGRETLNSLKTMQIVDRKPHLASLSNAGFTDSQIARLTGIAQPSINRTLRLL